MLAVWPWADVRILARKPRSTVDDLVGRRLEMAEIHEGGCPCNAVRYRVTGEPKLAYICHCTLCKRRTGSVCGFSAYFDDKAVQIISGELKTYDYRSDENNRGGPMKFCANCGTTVAWSAEAFPGIRGISAGTFDDPDWIKPTMHTWTRSALHWMVFPSDVETFETIPSNYRG
jgi:hypothetical protein